MALTNNLTYGIMRSVDSATMSSSYQVLGGAIENSASLLKIVNNSDEDVLVSVDGVIAHDIVTANGFILYDLTANAPQGLPGVFFLKGRQFYVKGTAGTGTIYLVYLYVSPAASSIAVVT